MKKYFLAVLLLFILSSCIDYHEKMKLNQDGSGTITFAVGVNQSLFGGIADSSNFKELDESKIKEQYSGKKGIKFLGSRTYTQDGNKWVEINLSFESLQALNEANKDSMQQGMMGVMNLSEDENGNMVFSRKLLGKPGESKNDTTGNGLASGMVQMMFGNYKWKYDLTLPGKIISTNAAQNDVDYKTNAVKWTMSLASLASAHEMTVTFEKASKINLTLIILGVLVVLFLAGIFIYRIKRSSTPETN
ncbi:MAG: hypothetical protein M1495_24775 [Bacteroidetes bacterium]|nr:hypothetical protein [Bacteroidota bacterium]